MFDLIINGLGVSLASGIAMWAALSLKTSWRIEDQRWEAKTKLDRARTEALRSCQTCFPDRKPVAAPYFRQDLAKLHDNMINTLFT